jgi:hypothetical protein
MSYERIQILLRLIDKELSYLEDNLYRHERSGDPYREANAHKKEIAMLKSIRKELTQ